MPRLKSGTFWLSLLVVVGFPHELRVLGEKGGELANRAVTGSRAKGVRGIFDECCMA